MEPRFRRQLEREMQTDRALRTKVVRNAACQQAAPVRCCSAQLYTCATSTPSGFSYGTPGQLLSLSPFSFSFFYSIISPLILLCCLYLDFFVLFWNKIMFVLWRVAFFLFKNILNKNFIDIFCKGLETLARFPCVCVFVEKEMKKKLAPLCHLSSNFSAQFKSQGKLAMTPAPPCMHAISNFSTHLYISIKKLYR